MAFGRKNESGDDFAKAELKAERDRIKAESKERKSAERDEKAQRRASEKEARAEAERVRVQRELETYGKLVIEQDCATKCVRIYDKGFVRVSGILIKERASFEKLRAISCSAEVTKKSGLGRTLMAGATLGLNLTTTPNQRGDMYLTISTDGQVHMIHMSPPTEKDMKAMHKLATAGQGILDHIERMDQSAREKNSTQLNSVENLVPQNSVIDELTKLSALRDSGAISEDEFQTLKKKLMS
jgi:hypothetical protein